MSLNLDDRQRAMLAEMDVHVWWPQPPPLAAPASAQLQAVNDPQIAIDNAADSAYSAAVPEQTNIKSLTGRKPSAAVTPPPSVLLPLPTGVDTMDWPTLRTSVASCQACIMCLGRRSPVLAAPPDALRADWLVLGEPPDDAQERAQRPFVDDAGKLLDNMLKSVGVRRYRPADGSDDSPAVTADPASTAYLSLVLKCRPALPGAPDAPAVAACATYLRREIALIQPKVILAMGRLAMQLLLSEDHPQGLRLPLGKLRGQVWHYQGVPVVVTYPPAYLLRNPQDKARAWEDLCLALDVVQGKPPDPV